MELLKIGLISIYLLYLYYRVGIFIKKIINSNSKELATTLIYGFVTNFAIFEIINIPFILVFKHHTKYLYIIFLIMNIALIALSYIIKSRVKDYDLIEKMKSINKTKINYNMICWCLAIIVIGWQICNSTFLFKEDADDAFYISLANEAKELENLYDTDPSVGIKESTFDKNYIFNTWEIYGGFLARVFDINTTTLFHTVYQIVFIILAYISYYLVLKKCLKKENLGIGILILSIVFLFTGVSAKFKGPFLLGRIYQGKSILLNILIPFVIFEILDYEKKKGNYLILTLAYISSLAFSPITIWLVSLIYGIFLLNILLQKDVNKFKEGLKLLIPIILICVIYILVAVLGNAGLEDITKSENFEQLEDFKIFLGEGKIIFVLYIISIFVIWTKGNVNQKNIGLYFPLLALLLVYNPLLTKIYIKLVTISTYWRLYWLLPLELTITIASIIIYDNIEEKKIKFAFPVFAIFILIISGKYMYTEERGFSKFENFEKIPNYIIDEAYYISKNSNDNTIVVGPSEPWESCMMRQYSTKILLMHSRDWYARENTFRKEFMNLYYEIYNKSNDEYDIDKINMLKSKYNVEWIILPKNKTLDVSEKLNYTIMTENENNYILKTRK